MQALEVGHFGGITGLGQRLEAGLDQLDHATAQHGLLAEQVGLGLFAEVGLDDAGTATADGGGIRQRQVTGSAGLVLVDGDQHGHAAAGGVGAAHRVARGLGRHHHHVQVGTRLHLTVVDVEAVCERQHCALLQVRLDVGLVGSGDVLVRHQDHHEVGALDGISHRSHLQAGRTGLAIGRTANAHAHRHVHTRILQVERMGMTLRAVADDGDLLALDQLEVGVLVVENFHGNGNPWSVDSGRPTSPRARPRPGKSKKRHLRQSVNRPREPPGGPPRRRQGEVRGAQDCPCAPVAGSTASVPARRGRCHSCRCGRSPGSPPRPARPGSRQAWTSRPSARWCRPCRSRR